MQPIYPKMNKRQVFESFLESITNDSNKSLVNEIRAAFVICENETTRPHISDLIKILEEGGQYDVQLSSIKDKKERNRIKWKRVFGDIDPKSDEGKKLAELYKAIKNRKLEDKDRLEAYDKFFSSTKGNYSPQKLEKLYKKFTELKEAEPKKLKPEDLVRGAGEIVEPVLGKTATHLADAGAELIKGVRSVKNAAKKNKQMDARQAAYKEKNKADIERMKQGGDIFGGTENATMEENDDESEEN